MATQPAEVIEPPIVLEQDNEQEEARDFEAEARVKGWRSPEEWPDGKPKPSKFKTPEEFLAAEDEHVGLLKKKYDHQERELKELKRVVRKLTQSEQNAYANALADLKAQQEAAVETGDLAAYRRVDTQIETLRKDAVADAGEANHGEDPNEQFDAFREANAWYDKGNLGSASEFEVEGRLLADRLADKYARQGLQKDLAPSEFFARIAQEVEEKFPQLKLRKAPRDKPASAVAGVTPNGGGNRSAKTGANLPADAKEAAAQYRRIGISKSYENCKTDAEAYDLFAKSYDWNKA